MKYFNSLIAWLVIAGYSFAGINHSDAPGLTLYVRIKTSLSASVAVAMSEGTVNAVGFYTVSDAALVSAGLTVAGTYDFKIFQGTPSTSANDTLKGYGILGWTGSVEVAAPVNVTHWDNEAVVNPHTAGVPVVSTDYVEGTAVNTVTGEVDANVTQWNDVDVTAPGVPGVPNVNITHVDDDPVSVATGGLDANVVSWAGSAAATTDIALLDTSGLRDAVWDAVMANHLDSGSTGAALNAGGAGGDPWSTALPGAYAAGTAGFILGTNLNATVSTRSTQVSVDAIENQTDDIGVAGAGLTAIPWSATWNTSVEDAVWDSTVADHLDAGTTGAALNAGGSSGDPWTTPLPGAYGAGTAGFIVGTNLNATVSTRATQASVDTVDNFVDDLEARIGTPSNLGAGATLSANAADIDSVLATVETNTNDLVVLVGTPSNLGSGATLSGNLIDIEGQTDDIGIAGAGLTNIPGGGGGGGGTDILTIEGTDATDVLDARIAAYGALKPTVASRTLDVTTAGNAGIDWANVENQGTNVLLTDTAIDTSNSVQTVNTPVDVGTVADKTGYSLTQAFPANFEDIAITPTGAVSINWGDIENPGANVDLSSTTIENVTQGINWQDDIDDNDDIPGSFGEVFKWWTYMVEQDGGSYRFTEGSLEEAPQGTGSGQGEPISPFLISDDHVWKFSRPGLVVASNAITESIGSSGVLVAMDIRVTTPDSASISTVSTLSITSGSGVVLGSATVSTDKKQVHFTIDTTSAVAGTYEVGVTFTTTDSQTFTRSGPLVIR